MATSTIPDSVLAKLDLVAEKRATPYGEVVYYVDARPPYDVWGSAYVSAIPTATAANVERTFGRSLRRVAATLALMITPMLRLLK